MAKNISDVFSGKAHVWIGNASSIEALSQIEKKRFRVDYCFTDPPYNGSIQYGELSYMWASWLRLDRDYVKTITDHEVIEIPDRRKTSLHTMPK